jgi:hypothetical protein
MTDESGEARSVLTLWRLDQGGFAVFSGSMEAISASTNGRGFDE